MDALLRPKTWVEISAHALRANHRTFRRLLGPSVALMAAVKANAYGHGMEQVARILASVPAPKRAAPLWFGVDSAAEALRLRESGIREQILVLGISDPADFLPMAETRVSFVLARFQDIACLPISARVHLKVETGTHRLGFFPEELPKVFGALHRRGIIPEGLYTHVADAENMHSPFLSTQRERFLRAESLAFRMWPNARLLRHLSATAAALRDPAARCDMVRVGIGLYGLLPDKGFLHHPIAKKLRPALSWKTRVVQVKRILKGESVGYDRTYHAARAMTIAVLPVGYWDGFDRRLSNTGTVLVRGKKASVVGRVCMNMTMADVSNIPRVREGDEVVLLGKQGHTEITAAEMAAALGTINYEVVTRINPLLMRAVV